MFLKRDDCDKDLIETLELCFLARLFSSLPLEGKVDLREQRRMRWKIAYPTLPQNHKTKPPLKLRSGKKGKIQKNSILADLVNSLVAPEEEGNCAGACVASDGGADVVDDNISAEILETLFNKLSNGLCVLYASGVRHKALA